MSSTLPRTECSEPGSLVEGQTVDALLRGRVVLRQPASGFRTNMDAVWLAAFAWARETRAGERPKVARAVLDLGAGVGPVSLVLLVAGAAERVTMLDVDAGLLELAAANAQESKVGERATVITHDLTQRLPEALHGAFDLVVANPPYGRAGVWVASDEAGRARARVCSPEVLAGFCRAARVALGAKGRACFVYPASDVPELIAHLRQVGLEPKRLRLVHHRLDCEASVALLEAKPARAGGLRVEPPLIVAIGSAAEAAGGGPSTLTAEASRLLDGDW